MVLVTSTDQLFFLDIFGLSACGPTLVYSQTLTALLAILEELIDTGNVAGKAGTPPGVVGAETPSS